MPEPCSRPRYVVGVDVGGTFTDTVIWTDDGRIGVGKAFTTYGRLGDGLHASLDAAAENLGLSGEEVSSETSMLVHGTTVGTNALVQRRGGRVGLICTAGHRDVLRMMRAAGRVAGLPVERLLDVAQTMKPEPIVDYAAVAEVAERATAGGDILVSLDEDDVRSAVRRLSELGCDAIAIAFLWSFVAPDNEIVCRALVSELSPSTYVSSSHEIAPRLGEYERTVSTVINAYVGPTLTAYLERLQDSLVERSFAGELRIMTCAGGVVRPEAALKRALLTIGSGPAAGVLACERLAHQRGDVNVIATDMGGTTFDAALLAAGRIARRQTAIIDQHEYFVETIDVQSIGAGGGSIARIVERSGALRVGPESAGSQPGPVCYGQGGTEPTITDADLVLGLIDPVGFLGGQLTLDVEGAERAIARLGAKLGMSAIEVASGISRIADERMADLIRRMTIQRGFDPRRFSVYAYGGAGPVHVGAYARSLGAARAVVPLGAAASVWSAVGAAAADVSHIRLRSLLMRQPFDELRVREEIRRLEEELEAELEDEGFDASQRRIERLAEVRHVAQVHSLEVALDDARDDPADWEQSLVERFERTYETRYGKGTSYREAGLEISAIKAVATGIRALPAQQRLVERALSRRPRTRRIYWTELGRAFDSQILPYSTLRTDDEVVGPTVIELSTTSIAVRPGQLAMLDDAGNVILQLHARESESVIGDERRINAVD